MTSTSPTISTMFQATMSPLESAYGGGAEVTPTDISSTQTQTTYISPSFSSQTPSSSAANNNSSRKRASPGTIAGGIIGSLAAVLVLALLFILWRRRKQSSGVGSNADEDIDDPVTSTVQNSNPILRSSSASEWTVSISTISSHTSDLPRRLSQSSRHAYEEEIERLRRELLSQKNHIRYIHEQIELTHNSFPPPSYRSRRSDLPPPLPAREISY
ncbi:hypothetical protein IW262DRAFT_1460630 [Armillaria fumosa]|nr:hypothetical protein IW262DRAFT_1460630 [Armillaria fumosa]